MVSHYGSWNPLPRRGRVASGQNASQALGRSEFWRHKLRAQRPQSTRARAESLRRRPRLLRRTRPLRRSETDNPETLLPSAERRSVCRRELGEPLGAPNRNLRLLSSFYSSFYSSGSPPSVEGDRAVQRPVWNFGAWIWRAPLATCRLLPSI